MFVERPLPAALETLVILADDAPLNEAARSLRTETDILVVCNSEGLLRGVITKTDVAAQIS